MIETLTELYQVAQTEFWTWLEDNVRNNDFAAGFIITGILGILAYLGRSVPSRVWAFTKRMSTMEVVINSTSSGFTEINQYVRDHVLIKPLSRTFVVTGAAPREFEQPGIILQPGYGTQLGWYSRRPVVVNRELLESDSGSFKERLTIQIVGRNRRVFDRLMGEIEGDRKKEITIWTPSSDYWNDYKKLARRDLSTVVLPAGQSESIVRRVEDFLGRREWYTNRGIPYRLGLMFYGEPGCGKTSMIHALASHFRRDIYFLGLSSVASDANLVSLMSDVKRDSIIVLEDIDAWNVNLDRDSDEHSKVGVSIAGLLNVLDGIMALEDQVVIATTNRIETLDPALTRKGRFDIHVHFGRLDYEDFLVLARRFYNDVTPLENIAYRPMKPCDAQAVMIEHDDPWQASAAFQKMFVEHEKQPNAETRAAMDESRAMMKPKLAS